MVKVSAPGTSKGVTHTATVRTVDCHVDALWVHFKRQILGKEAPPPLNLTAMRSGGLCSAFFALYLPDGLQDGMSQAEVDVAIDWQLQTFRQEFSQVGGQTHPQYVALEGCRLLGNTHPIQRLVELASEGVKYITITHNRNNFLGDSATDKHYHKGLTALGKEIIRSADNLGFVIDISHASDLTAKAVFREVYAPVLATHSGVRTMVDHPRNLTDELIKAVAASKGVICVPFAKNFIGKYTVTDHIDYIIQLTGSTSFVGIGSDLDGAEMVPACPDASYWKKVVVDGLWGKGYADVEIDKIAGLNILRVV